MDKDDLKILLEDYIKEARELKELGELAPEDLKYRVEYTALAAIWINFGPNSNGQIDREKMFIIFEDLKNGIITDANVAIKALENAGFSFDIKEEVYGEKEYE